MKSAANRARVIELSKAMCVMRPFTTLLVPGNERICEQFNVNRGRKDHWGIYSCPENIATVHQPDPNNPAALRFNWIQSQARNYARAN